MPPLPAAKTVVFDVVGTLVSYDHLVAALEARLGPRLAAANIKPLLLAMCWIAAAEREHAHLALAGRRGAPFAAVLAALLPRVLLRYAGVPPAAGAAAAADDDDDDAAQAWPAAAWRALRLRPGAAQCVAKLRAAGFAVWCFTAADAPRAAGYFRAAGLDMPAERVVSCDGAAGPAKPAPAAYRGLLARLEEAGEAAGAGAGPRPWYAAAHMWDVSAARAAGFHGAYSTVLEGEPLTELFGDMDVVAPTLPELADAIIAATK